MVAASGLSRRNCIRRLFVLLAVVVAPLTARAGLLDPTDFPFRGLSDQEWGQAYISWAVVSGLGDNSLPDSLNGGKFLPPNYGGGDFSTSLTIPAGMAVVGAPFFVFGENYDDGSSDLDIPDLDDLLALIFDTTTITSSLDGVELLNGPASSFADRMIDFFLFPAPIPYATPQPRGSVNAVAAVFGLGILTVYDDLPRGEHTIVNTIDSEFFGQSSYTYRVNVVPEPGSLLLLGSTLAAGLFARRRRLSAPQQLSG